MTPLYVRLPTSAAEKLDRAAFELMASKQDLVASLLARYVDPSSPEKLRSLAELLGEAGTRRVTVETQDESVAVGRRSFQPAEAPEVLTLDELAELLKADRETVVALADEGTLPGRRVGGEWRFARRAVLDWLSGADEPSGG